jgi:hypothetical protein
MYLAYTEIERIMCGSVEPYYTFKEFLENIPMCVIDVTKRMRAVDDGGTSKKLVHDFENDVPAKTLCYIIMLGLKSFDYSYNIKNQIIIESI